MKTNENDLNLMLDKFLDKLESDLSSAFTILNEAKTTAEIKKDPLDFAKVEKYFALYYINIKDNLKAEDSFRKAVAILSSIDDRDDLILHEYYEWFGYEFIKLGDYLKAIIYYEKSVDIIREIGNKSILAKDLGNLGGLYKATGKLLTSLNHFEEALAIYENIGDESQLALIYNNISGVYTQQGKIGKSLEALLKSLSYYEKLDDQSNICMVDSNIGVMYVEMKQYSKAISFLEKALDGINKRENWDLTIHILSNLGSVYLLMKEYRTALDYFNETLKFDREIGNKYDIARDLNDIGKVYIEIGKPDKAYNYFFEAMEIAEVIEDFNLLSVSLLDISRVYCIKKDFEEEERFLKRSLSLSTKYNFMKTTQKCYYQLSILYRDNKIDHTKSLSSLEKYIEIEKDLAKQEYSSKIAEMQTKYETESTEKEAEIYRLKNLELSNKNRTIQKQKEELEQTLANLEISEINYNYVSQELKRNIGSTIIGNSKQMKKLVNLIAKVAKADTTTVLITGESGTGKELIARAIHDFSKRKANPFCAVNVSAVPESLFESEFFGYKKNAFTGAVKDKIGWFEVADNGSLFLDEVGTFPMAVQTKLLRVLEERKITKLGSFDEKKVDLRIICATNDNVFDMVENKTFREDLYHRLSTFVINIPPLRDRKEDIYSLLEHFVNIFSTIQNKQITKIDKNIELALLNYSFPGNVRELKNLVERAIIMCNSSTLKLSHFSIPQDLKSKKGLSNLQSDEEIIHLDALEKDMIIKALNKANFVQSEAAKLLGIKPKAIERRMVKFDLKRK